MLAPKRQHPEVKSQLHPRNKHRHRYDLKLLSEVNPELVKFVIINKYGDESIGFFNPQAVKALNQALLKQYYEVDYWDVPAGYLCPPIPGRADYLHYAADLLASSNYNKIPTGDKIRCLDVGVGASCVFPLIGTNEYRWHFIGSDIDEKAIASAQEIIDKNMIPANEIVLRQQKNKYEAFKGVLFPEEYVDISICNPPFHASREAAAAATQRKHNNLKKTKVLNPIRNFGGVNSELWCIGGEFKFVKNMIHESFWFGSQCMWFTSQISKDENVGLLKEELARVKAKDVRVIDMGQGNKISRILAWTFLSLEEQKLWVKKRW
ncbi:MAG: 23S rRNA (adenine(1618)-N(6))-methyltransferase RlmF [Bacteroidales bacterium]|nr:23S rRNA (adenine(1618)-N(6))-methyltransferase RlmF [Bacteroidales bacterium]